MSAPLTSRPRVAQFTRAFYLGGTETQVVELLRGLAPDYAIQVGVLEREGPLLADVEALGHRPERFSLRGSFAHPNTAWQTLRLARWLRARRIELVHVHDFYASLIAVPAARMAGCKVLIGRLDLAHWHQGPRRALWMGATQLAHHVVVNAEAIQRMLIVDEGVPRERITVVRNGLDVTRFDRRQADGLRAPLPDTGSAPVVVHVANMNSIVKRQEDLIDALRIVKEAGRPLHALLVGDGPRRPLLERRAQEQGVGERVHFLGHRQDVPAIFAGASFGVLCSSAEGLSNAIMEGMAASRAMVVTRAGGNHELISDGDTGLVVPACNPAQLAHAFRTLVDAPHLAARLGGAARKQVEAELSVERMVAAHDALYRRMLHPDGASAAA